MFQIVNERSYFHLFMMTFFVFFIFKKNSSYLFMHFWMKLVIYDLFELNQFILLKKGKLLSPILKTEMAEKKEKNYINFTAE